MVTCSFKLKHEMTPYDSCAYSTLVVYQAGLLSQSCKKLEVLEVQLNHFSTSHS